MLKSYLLLSLFALSLFSLVFSDRSDGTDLRVIEKQILDTILRAYDPRIRPNGIGNEEGPVKVELNLYWRMIEKFEVQDGELTGQMTFRQIWTDERLAFSSITSRIPYINIFDTKSIWTPDTFISNSIEGSKMKILSENILIRIQPDGQILYSTRLRVVLNCPTDLRYYPFDHQTCNMRMASYAYTTKDVRYQWKDTNPIQISKSLYIAEYALRNISNDYCTSRTNTGEYSCAKLELAFSHQGTRELIMLYIPTTMYSIIAFFSFFINPKRFGTGRLIYCLIVLLLCGTNINMYNRNSPQASYTRAVDVWTGTIMTFLFATLLQLILVLRAIKNSNKNSTDSDTESDAGVVQPLVGDSEKVDPAAAERQQIILSRIRQLGGNGDRLDKLARWVYPVLFVAFNFIYWVNFWPRYRD